MHHDLPHSYKKIMKEECDHVMGSHHSYQLFFVYFFKSLTISRD